MNPKFALKKNLYYFKYIIYNMASVGYYQNSHLATPPVGSIMEYLGATDPDGWIICNGTARTNNQDGRYNALNSLAIGTGGSGISNYTPPDLRGKFLIGASSTYPLSSTSGNATVTLIEANLPSHSHSMDHQHYVNFNGNTAAYPNWYTNNASFGNGAYVYTNNAQGIPTSYPLVLNGSSYGYPNYNVGKTITDATGSGTAFSILPPYRAVNYIIKY